MVLAKCKIMGDVILPEKYLYPLIEKEHFYEEEPVPRRYVLIPYNPGTANR